MVSSLKEIKGLPMFLLFKAAMVLDQKLHSLNTSGPLLRPLPDKEHWLLIGWWVKWVIKAYLNKCSKDTKTFLSSVHTPSSTIM